MTLSVAGIVLASGMSTRFGGSNKLLARVGGVSVVERTVRAYVDADLQPVLAVVGYGAVEVEAALRSLPVRYVLNPEFRLGQSRALVRGIAALPRSVEGVVIGVADQPFLTATSVRSLVDRFREDWPLLVAPRYGGRIGNPVLFHRQLFPELLQVEGDQGGRAVVRRHRESIGWVEFDDDRAARDIDTPEDLEAANRETG